MKERAIEMTPGDLIAVETLDDEMRLGGEAERRFGVTDGAVRDAMKPLFMLMFRHGIQSFMIERDRTRVKVAFN